MRRQPPVERMYVPAVAEPIPQVIIGSAVSKPQFQNDSRNADDARTCPVEADALRLQTSNKAVQSRHGGTITRARRPPDRGVRRQAGEAIVLRHLLADIYSRLANDRRPWHEASFVSTINTATSGARADAARDLLVVGAVLLGPLADEDEIAHRIAARPPARTGRGISTPSGREGRLEKVRGVRDSRRQFGAVRAESLPCTTKAIA